MELLVSGAVKLTH